MSHTAHRILAIFRVWGTITYFDPYPNLIRDWDRALREALEDVPKVTTDIEYAMAIARMYAHINDSHGYISAPGFVKAFAAPMPFVAQTVQGRLTIVRVDPALARGGGYRVGDVIESIDGEAVTTRAARLRPYIPASTSQAANEALDLDYARTPSLLAGPIGSVAVLGLRGPDGRVTEVRVRRQYASPKIYRRTRPPIDVLPGNVSYIDLARLTAEQVDDALPRTARTVQLFLTCAATHRPTFRSSLRTSHVFPCMGQSCNFRSFTRHSTAMKTIYRRAETCTRALRPPPRSTLSPLLSLSTRWQ